MKKLLTLTVAVFAFALSASATTPFKNLHVAAEIVPSEAGEIYLMAKSTEDEAYVYAISEDLAPEVFLMATFGENGTQDQYAGCSGYAMDVNGTNSNYEAKLIISPADGYEVVCVSKTVLESGVYSPDVCHQSHTGTGYGDFVFSWEWDVTDAGNLVNINSAAKEVDGTSDENSIGRDGCFALDNWNDVPDTKLYVIMRKIGETSPSFDENLQTLQIGDANTDGVVDEADAVAVADYRLNRGAVNTKYADANGDGKVNVADAVTIVNMIKGK